MDNDNLDSNKSKTDSFNKSFRDKMSSPSPAIMVLAIIVVALVLFNIKNQFDLPTVNLPPGNETKESTGTVARTEEATSTAVNSGKLASYKDTAGDLLEKQLNSIISATRKIPLRAKITTDQGFKGLWIQQGKNQRFEDPSKNHIIIVNTSKKKLWVIDMARKTASENPLDALSESSCAKLSAILFIEGLSGAPIAETKNFEDILPVGSDAVLTFTKNGLPDRWEGTKQSSVHRFVDWDYIQEGSIPPSEFELPAGLQIIKQAATTTTIKPGPTTTVKQN